MATGDIDGAIISRGTCGGSVLWVHYAALDAAGTDSLGTTTPKALKISIACANTAAFNGTSSTTTSRTLYATTVVPLPYSSGTASQGSFCYTIPISGNVTSGPFRYLETVTQATTGATGRVVAPDPGVTPITIDTKSGSWDNSHTFTGGTSGASATPTAGPTLLANRTGTALWSATNGTGCWRGYMLDQTAYAGETYTLTAPSAVYTDGGAHPSNAVSGLAVTNQSQVAYPVPSLAWLPAITNNAISKMTMISLILKFTFSVLLHLTQDFFHLPADLCGSCEWLQPDHRQ